RPVPARFRYASSTAPVSRGDRRRGPPSTHTKRDSIDGRPNTRGYVIPQERKKSSSLHRAKADAAETPAAPASCARQRADQSSISSASTTSSSAAGGASLISTSS